MQVTATPERALVSVGEWPLRIMHSRYEHLTDSVLKRLPNGRLNSETAVRRFQKRKIHLDPEVNKKIRWGF